MSVYRGWQAQFLKDAFFPNTATNRQFLNDWHAHADSDCALNPVDLTEKTAHSGNCKKVVLLKRGVVHYQAYTSAVETLVAWFGQITSGDYPHLHAALKSGDPYTVSDSVAVGTDIDNWGSNTFANFYLNEVSQGGPPPTLKAPQALRGWTDMQRAVNHHLPAALHTSQRARHAALRELHRARKVLS